MTYEATFYCKCTPNTAQRVGGDKKRLHVRFACGFCHLAKLIMMLPLSERTK